MKKEGKLSRIPFDLTREILLRLPARSVIRFRIACKLWRSTTLDPNFVEAHLHLARKVSPPSILLAPRRTDTGLTDYTILGLGLGGDTWTPKQRFSKRGCENLWFHGSCNGIICISYDDDTADKIFFSTEDYAEPKAAYKIIQLLNPATGDSLTLPKARRFFRAFFGFHPATKEYKVIIIYDIDPDRPPGSRMPGCQVYTIGTEDASASASWRDVDVIQGFEPYQATLHNGVIYSTSEKDLDTVCIVSFDLKDESFKQFPLIDFGEMYDFTSVCIIELQGSLCIYLKFEDQRMEVWKLSTDNYGRIDEHGWTLLYSILPWDGMETIDALFIHKDKVLTMSILHSKPNDISDYGIFFSMACYRYVNKGNFGVNKILYMHNASYYTHVHVESLVALPNQ